MPIYTYEHALSYLFSLEKKGITLSIESTQEALTYFKNPHQKFKSILVAGTNGKGSTVAMLTSILVQAGYKVGTYISPHLLDVRERIQLNQKMISKKELIYFINDTNRMLAFTSIKLSFFELMTVIAFRYFEREKVDFAVVEVGLGGRLDSTNVLSPLASVITSIDFDHQRLLGNTLTKIALEKAGIIKPKTPLVTAVAQKKIQKLFQKICHQKQSPIYILGKDFLSDPTLSLSLPGKYHQQKNAACVLEVIRLLQKKWEVSKEAIQKGLLKTVWPGRLEVVQKKPKVLLDGAHNPAGVRVLLRALKTDFQYDKLHVVFGVMADKNYQKMFRMLLPHADSFYFVEPPIKRALQKPLLLETMPELKHKIEFCSEIPGALSSVISKAGRNDLVCVTGSLYTVSEAKKYFL
ncbi:MAG: hypothetical protein A2Z91_07450 [Deltaproteobacteria bacterium GWA2_38_16]|nr:MAG: hypothetical protein A2Z91_07450 [Deltaproteobacteria bacterium GWA2_38_16]OGQ02742.1 MAG: hypothetical protein A3D19_00785 [Deltaproteobacteria bacterium RIFCSPHIGHO2_02_FULL_38_15]OGQ31859.1 MAG: hypothetical protein A3A72_02280 [Deltaproteobacteria bacterium RIFCSPLOWO2_01_FULL_38_9]OGQ59074.1 MAG: hypothetical protein A3G92_06115 [Deltaproteobacteria bacterium RIFCSPLOWO2_12_FULL_38_8]HBQ20603.1 hypothetical protein [Deltaproteobacteria bacterium]